MMFDNENNEQNKAELGERQETNVNPGSTYGSGSNSTSGSAENVNSNSYGSGNQGSTYGSQNNTYGNGSQNNTYGNGQGYTYGSGNQNGSYGSNQNNSYGTGNYNQNSNTGSYGNYSQNRNTNGNYNYNNQGTYGNYQYTYNQPGMNGGNGPVKRNTGKKVAAVIAAALVLSLGLGAGYYSMTRITQMPALTDSQDQASAADKNKAADDNSVNNESGSQADAGLDSTTDIIADNNADSGIAQTETVENSKTVVTDVTEVVAKAMPAMVSINNNYTQSASYFGQTYSKELTASGSGIIVGTNDNELLVATNYHVIEGADSLEVFFVDEKTAKAEVKGTDSNMDLAVIAVQLSDLSEETKNAIAIATLGDSDSLILGEPAIAIGNALGYGQSVTTGVISAVNRMIDLDNSKQGTFIQTNAAINPGNSGGALLNIRGEVIGINSNKIGGEAIEGMGYAIPISTAKPIIEQLMTEKTRSKLAEDQRGYLGISGVGVTSDVSQMYGLPLGVYVASVADGSGAKNAGIQESDIITKFDGKEISSMEDLQNKLAYYEAGETVTVTVKRQSTDGYQDQDIQVTLGTKPTVQSDSNTEGEKYQGGSNPDAKPEEGQDGQDGQQGGYEINPFENPFGFGFNFGN
ncbi:trypsin-like peptidase domain-containing protein [Butyrivibrio sp. LC3010]|uniref:trypsin-like peptidase domain-containing protein n=1 Tax=Butyrivibrio sp. LC3010 TaxID=1280680 RepID=UPI0004294ACF|nr:trypsin-like peptidase domain-containing protein [Butyrivibrio sp. LC3010]